MEEGGEIITDINISKTSKGNVVRTLVMPV